MRWPLASQEVHDAAAAPPALTVPLCTCRLGRIVNAELCATGSDMCILHSELEDTKRSRYVLEWGLCHINRSCIISGEERRPAWQHRRSIPDSREGCFFSTQRGLPHLVVGMAPTNTTAPPNRTCQSEHRPVVADSPIAQISNY